MTKEIKLEANKTIEQVFENYKDVFIENNFL